MAAVPPLMILKPDDHPVLGLEVIGDMIGSSLGTGGEVFTETMEFPSLDRAVPDVSPAAEESPDQTRIMKRRIGNEVVH